MIKFFRRFRLKFLSQNKISKYLLYSAGEIILVVIGILIALSINNWNERNKRIEKGNDILKDLRENIEFNTIQFQKDNEVSRQVITSIDYILHNITVTKSNTDSLGRHLRFASWWTSSRWKSSGYEALVDHGTDVIRSKELRGSVISLYVVTYAEILENNRLQEGNWIAMLPKWLEFVERDASDFSVADQHSARPFDYEEMAESRIFKSMLTFLRSQRLADIQLRNNGIQENMKLLELIDKELEEG